MAEDHSYYKPGGDPLLNFLMTDEKTGLDQSELLSSGISMLTEKLAQPPKGSYKFMGFSVEAAMVLIDAAATVSQLSGFSFYGPQNGRLPILDLGSKHTYTPGLPCAPDSYDANVNPLSVALDLDHLTGWCRSLEGKDLTELLEGLYEYSDYLDRMLLHDGKPVNSAVPGGNDCWLSVTDGTAVHGAVEGWMKPLIDAHYVFQALRVAVYAKLGLSDEGGEGEGEESEESNSDVKERLDRWTRPAKTRTKLALAAMDRAILPASSFSDVPDDLDGNPTAIVEVLAKVKEGYSASSSYAGSQEVRMRTSEEGRLYIDYGDDGDNPFSGAYNGFEKCVSSSSVTVSDAYKDGTEQALNNCLRDHYLQLDLSSVYAPVPFGDWEVPLWPATSVPPALMVPKVPYRGMLRFCAGLLGAYRKGMRVVRPAGLCGIGPWSREARLLGISVGADEIYGPMHGSESWKDVDAWGEYGGEPSEKRFTYMQRTRYLRESGGYGNNGPLKYYNAAFELRYEYSCRSSARSSDGEKTPLPYNGCNDDNSTPSSVGGIETGSKPFDDFALWGRNTIEESVKANYSTNHGGCLFSSNENSMDLHDNQIVRVSGAGNLARLPDDCIQATVVLPFYASAEVVHEEGESKSSSSHETSVFHGESTPGDFYQIYYRGGQSFSEEGESSSQTRKTYIYGLLKVGATLLRPALPPGEVLPDAYFRLKIGVYRLAKEVFKELDTDATFPEYSDVSCSDFVYENPESAEHRSEADMVTGGPDGSEKSAGLSKNPSHLTLPTSNSSASARDSVDITVRVGVGSSMDLGPYKTPMDFDYTVVSTAKEVGACSGYRMKSTTTGTLPDDTLPDGLDDLYPEKRAQHLEPLLESPQIVLHLTPPFLDCL